MEQNSLISFEELSKTLLDNAFISSKDSIDLQKSQLYTISAISALMEVLHITAEQRALYSTRAAAIYQEMCKGLDEGHQD